MSTQLRHERIGRTALVVLATTAVLTAPVAGARFTALSPDAPRPLPRRQAVQTTCTQPPDGMIGWWTFDELETFALAVGDVFGDKAGVNNPGIPIGDPDPATIREGEYVENSLALNGRDQYVRVADHPELSFGAGDLTIDAWIRVDEDDTGGGRRPIVDKSAPGPTGASYGYAFFVEDGHLGFTLSGMSGVLADVRSDAPVKDGWHFVAVTVERAADPANAVATLFVNNNTPERFAVAPSAEAVDNAADLLIGTDIPGQDRQDQHYFWGGIDEVELFGRALTPDEIGAIFASGAAGKCKTPVYPALPVGPKGLVLHGVQLVNIDVVNACNADATGFRFVLTGFGATPVINSTNYGFKDVYEVPCPIPNTAGVACNPFTPQKAVPVYTASGAGVAGSIELGWHASTTATLATGQFGHFGYTLAPAVSYTAHAQLTSGPSHATLCESVAPSSWWSSFGTTVTMTLQNPMRVPMEVVTRATVSEQRVTLGDLVPSNAALMRSLGDPLTTTVLEPGAVQTVTLSIGPTDRTAVVLSDWYAYDGRRGALQARAFHARQVDGAIMQPAARRFFPWAGNMAATVAVSTPGDS